MALEVASALKSEFDLIISRKIPIPTTPEGGFGAIADDGTMILNEAAVKRIRLNPQQIQHESAKVRAEIKKRIMLYKGERPLVIFSGKTVIIIDDGLASGITMTAAVESARHRRPKEIVVAVPVAPVPALKRIEKVADKVITSAKALMPKFYIADYYRYWHDVSDDEVVRYLNQWRTQQFWANIKPPQNG